METISEKLRRRFPSLDVYTAHALMRHFRSRGGVAAVLSATDDELLAAVNFGPHRLAAFRSVWPGPMKDVSTGDPWRDHAEMVAGG